MTYLAWFLVHSFTAWCALTARRDDGNVWGFYIKDKKINIGDFWLALAVMYNLYYAFFNLMFFVKV